MLASLFADETEIGNDFPESLALLGVSNGIFERHSRAAHAHGTELEASDVQDVEGDDVSLADFAKQVFDGNLAVFRMSGQVDDPRIPILCSSAPIEKPGKVRSTRNAVNFSPSIFAKTVKRSAKPALVIHIFSPFRM